MCDTNFTTPANTTGMGNPSLPSETAQEVGSGDIFVKVEQKPKKKMKSLKDYLKGKKNS